MLDLLVEDPFKPLGHLRNQVIRTIERQAIVKDSTDVCNKLFGIDITRVLRVGVWLGRVRCHELALDCTKVHRMFDDSGIVRDVQKDWIDRTQKGTSVFRLLDLTETRTTESPLSDREWRPRLGGDRCRSERLG
jgi:hypothetical protein